VIYGGVAVFCHVTSTSCGNEAARVGAVFSGPGSALVSATRL